MRPSRRRPSPRCDRLASHAFDRPRDYDPGDGAGLGFALALLAGFALLALPITSLCILAANGLLVVNQAIFLLQASSRTGSVRRRAEHSNEHANEPAT